MCKTSCCSYKKDLGLLVLRVFVGGTFIFHGVLKAMHMQETVGFFGQIGFTNPMWAYVATYSEIIGGVALVLGLFTMYASILVGIVVAVAAFKVKWTLDGVPFMGRYLASELDLSLLASCIAIICLGSGSWSLSRWCKCKCHQSGTGKCGICKAVGCVECKGDHCSVGGSSTNPVSSGM